VRGYHAFIRDDTLSTIETHRQQIQALTRSYRFHRPVERLRQNQQRLDDLTARLHRSMHQHLRTARQRLAATQQTLALLDPQRPLQRGYARIERQGQPIKKAAALRPKDDITLIFEDGTRQANVIK
ncbi:MAG TPA: exodeoxyribonuclease VII large subunit, partial [Rhodothermales bacterium]|nr:exodeoxyribonuclease VII large subunit [Rhodothermales bacterium]